MSTSDLRTASAALVLALGTALAASACGGGAAPAGGTSGTGGTPATSTTAPPTSPSTSPPLPSSPSGGPATSAPAGDTALVGSEEEAVALVRELLAALDAGERARAEEMLGPVSRASVEDMGGLERTMSALAEGMARFRDPGTTFDAVAVPGREGTWLVSSTGTVEREGMRERDAFAWVVQPVAGSNVVEAVRPAGVHPAPGGAGSDASVAAVLPAGEVVVAVDGRIVTDGVSAEPAEGDRQLVRVQPPASPQPGGGTVVFASFGPGGEASALAVLVRPARG